MRRKLPLAIAATILMHAAAYGQHTALAPGRPPVAEHAEEPAQPVATAEAILPSPRHLSVLPVGMPLRVRLDHSYSLRVGTRVEGHLVAPIYLYDHIVLPVNTPVYGEIIGKHPVSKSIRTNALLDGDFTPLKEAEVTFDRVALPDHTQIAIETTAIERTAGVVHMSVAASHNSLISMAVADVRHQKDAAIETVTAPNKTDRLRRFFYGQLLYHPQELWVRTEFDADLTEPVSIDEAATTAPIPVTNTLSDKPRGTLQARLTEPVGSDLSKPGSTITATLSEPLFDEQHTHILLPEGTRLTGSVIQSEPAKSFGRNGKLRFTFRKIEIDGANQPIHGQLTAAEANGRQNLAIDEEGTAKTTSPNKVLGTLTLLLLASASHDHDDKDGGGGNNPVRAGVVSNGFGLLARGFAMASQTRNVSTGLAYYALAKNVYRQWIAKGKDVTFPKDTRIQIELSER